MKLNLKIINIVFILIFSIIMINPILEASENYQFSYATNDVLLYLENFSTPLSVYPSYSIVQNSTISAPYGYAELISDTTLLRLFQGSKIIINKEIVVLSGQIYINCLEQKIIRVLTHDVSLSRGIYIIKVQNTTTTIYAYTDSDFQVNGETLKPANNSRAYEINNKNTIKQSLFKPEAYLMDKFIDALSKQIEELNYAFDILTNRIFTILDENNKFVQLIDTSVSRINNNKENLVKLRQVLTDSSNYDMKKVEFVAIYKQISQDIFLYEYAKDNFLLYYYQAFNYIEYYKRIQKDLLFISNREKFGEFFSETIKSSFSIVNLKIKDYDKTIDMLNKVLITTYNSILQKDNELSARVTSLISIRLQMEEIYSNFFTLYFPNFNKEIASVILQIEFYFIQYNMKTNIYINDYYKLNTEFESTYYEDSKQYNTVFSLDELVYKNIILQNALDIDKKISDEIITLKNMVSILEFFSLTNQFLNLEEKNTINKILKSIDDIDLKAKNLSEVVYLMSLTYRKYTQLSLMMINNFEKNKFQNIFVNETLKYFSYLDDLIKKYNDVLNKEQDSYLLYSFVNTSDYFFETIDRMKLLLEKKFKSIYFSDKPRYDQLKSQWYTIHEFTLNKRKVERKKELTDLYKSYSTASIVASKQILSLFNKFIVLQREKKLLQNKYMHSSISFQLAISEKINFSATSALDQYTLLLNTFQLFAELDTFSHKVQDFSNSLNEFFKALEQFLLIDIESDNPPSKLSANVEEIRIKYFTYISSFFYLTDMMNKYEISISQALIDPNIPHYYKDYLISMQLLVSQYQNTLKPMNSILNIVPILINPPKALQ